ncbi:MAG: MarR family transcriptional regulator [Victivallaceae bacterium]|nr:MarR family transcriptional regulator [Victivallaceae bacterium]
MKKQPSLWREIWKLSLLMRNRGEKSELLRNDEMARRITLAQARVIDQFLKEPSDGMMLKDLAARLNLTPGAVSLLVDSLVRQNILSRRVSESDRRAVSITLSPSGEEFRVRFETFFDELSREMIAGVDPRDLETFLRVLGQLGRNLEKNGVTAN